MFKVIEYNGKSYSVSVSKYMCFIAFSSAVVNSSMTDSDKKAAIERYLNTLIN